MYSRAHLLIERDYEELQSEKPWGIEAHPVKSDNIFEWTAKILGLKGSAWEGGVFRMYIKFDEHYNYRAPDVCFHTIPFHPNVDMITGKPCIDFLDNVDRWKESFTLSYILLAVQSLLCNPVLDDAVNIEAVEMMTYSPHTYKQVVHDCVAASQRVEAGLNPHPTTTKSAEKVRFAPQKQATLVKDTPKTAPPKIGKLSFEDYHNTWSGIATSKSSVDAKNNLLESIKDNPSLQTIHYGLPLDELQAQMDHQLNEHGTLMYGKFRNTKVNEEESKQQKMEKVNQMRKIYLQPRTPHKTPYSSEGPLKSGGGRMGAGGEEEPWEKEVDDLVAWTSKLDDDNL